MSTLVTFILLTDGLIGLLRPHVFASDMSADGWGSETLLPAAMLALVSGMLYTVPRTGVLALSSSQVSLAALAVHLRVTQEVILPEIINVALGVGAWGGLWLRDPRLRTLLPLR